VNAPEPDRIAAIRDWPEGTTPIRFAREKDARTMAEAGERFGDIAVRREVTPWREAEVSDDD